MAKQIMFTGVRQVQVVDVEPALPLKENEVLVRAMYTGISTGTERTIYRGTAPFYNKKFDESLHLFLKSEDCSYKYPLLYGYENIGTVAEVGAGVTKYRVGDIVGSYYPHISEYVCPEEALFLLPEGLEPKYGVFMALAGVAYNGILDAEILLGETVVIYGAGVVGQILVQLAKKSGAGQVIMVDLCEHRLELAKKSGADLVINPAKIEDVALEIRSLTENRGADVVIEASGSVAALQSAIRTVGFQGRVIVVSFLAGKADALYLGDEFHHNRIRLISSQASGVNPGLYPRWTPERKFKAALAMLPSLKLDHLISHEFTFEQAAEAYRLCDESPDQTMQVIFRV